MIYGTSRSTRSTMCTTAAPFADSFLRFVAIVLIEFRVNHLRMTIKLSIYVSSLPFLSSIRHTKGTRAISLRIFGKTFSPTEEWCVDIGQFSRIRTRKLTERPCERRHSTPMICTQRLMQSTHFEKFKRRLRGKRWPRRRQ